MSEVSTERRWQVVAADWTPPDDIVDSFDEREAAEAHAERLDGLALRCYVRDRDRGTT